MPTESEYGNRIRDLERQVTVLEQQIKQQQDLMVRIQEANEKRDARTLITMGSAITTLVGVIILLAEKIVVAGGLK